MDQIRIDKILKFRMDKIRIDKISKFRMDPRKIRISILTINTGELGAETQHIAEKRSLNTSCMIWGQLNI